MASRVGAGRPVDSASCAGGLEAGLFLRAQNGPLRRGAKTNPSSVRPSYSSIGSGPKTEMEYARVEIPSSNDLFL